MKQIENFDNEEAAFALYRLVAEEDAGSDVDDDRMEEQLRERLAAALADSRLADTLIAEVMKSEDRAGAVARAALLLIRDQDLIPNGRDKIAGFIKNPPAGETMDFGIGIAGIVMLALVSTTRVSFKQKRKRVTKRGATETEFSASIGSEAVVGFVKALLAKVGVLDA